MRNPAAACNHIRIWLLGNAGLKEDMRGTGPDTSILFNLCPGRVLSLIFMHTACSSKK